MPEHIPPRSAGAVASSSSNGLTASPSPSHGKTVFIDNYDSFTYNIVQFLSELGADLHVYRNDEITLDELVAIQPARLIISPGPGHPLKDSGISIQAIQHFAGRIPILGVCMGLQCIYAAYTGIVDFAGEILHGKTSKVEHDGKGLYAGLGEVIGTRYHSLAANISSLPAELVVTSKTASGVVMGIRHTRLAMEAVQYHPESILSVGGREMLQNFLGWTGPTWADNPQAGIDAQATRNAEKTAAPVMAMGGAPESTSTGGAPATITPSSVGTILQRIHAQRLRDIATSKALPGLSPTDLQLSIAMHLSPPLINFPKRLAARRHLGVVGVMAEMKRASPSKGDIALGAHAGAQALAYARAGADVISVLTEPKWFKGSLGDLALARQAVDGLPNRPAILRKDFIIDPYQIDEARLYGADTVLLIVAMLEDAHLQELYSYSVALGMEPLVEVNNAEEMKRALAIGAKVVGVNNRNLHDFNVDMSTTSRLADAARAGGVTLCALSGISKRADVLGYQQEGVGAVLVGEALMRSQDKKAFVNDLVGLPVPSQATDQQPLVKVCGLSTVDAAVTATLAGADMLGLIFAPNTKRTVSLANAAEIISVVRSLRGGDGLRNAALAAEAEVVAAAADKSSSAVIGEGASTEDWFDYTARTLRSAVSKHKPLIVGVFRDQSVEEIVQVASTLKLDGVQLHGRTEEVAWAKLLPGVWVTKVFHVDAQARFGVGALRELGRRGQHHLVALDTAGVQSANGAGAGDGGTGQSFDHSLLPSLAQSEPALTALRSSTSSTDATPSSLPPAHPIPVILAGGLTPENVAQAVRAALAAGVQILAVDTSSGVEIEGRKSTERIQGFVRAVKG
ncbi:putative anthranilate synthase component II [Microstroma glucosiphilum]|uniref:Multifunctional tryptophan biosynthesis protein n=1 Tax=Pseudomicrostroma glucosiphilum TaxID=1684307 RepID=A0A316UEG1_9BASI|nr:putative anthranilate synthase component II [Pseudomicrostroma glucosiphilum]PWN23600.1 putative anthranilate synthase component II [Pseudomicrostroma glucosiphilum]